jgi:hypothetical protein
MLSVRTLAVFKVHAMSACIYNCKLSQTLLASMTGGSTLRNSNQATNVMSMLIFIKLDIKAKFFGVTRFKFLMVVSMKMAVFWVVAPCSLVEIY